MTTSSDTAQTQTLVIRNAHIAPSLHSQTESKKQTYDIYCDATSKNIRAIVPHPSPDVDGGVKVKVVDANGGLVIPSLCHAHIHIDKCYILEDAMHDELVSGDFPEALRITASYKSTLSSASSATEESMHARMTRLVRSSVLAGVTHMRAHVEVDGYVSQLGMRVAQRVREEWEGVCGVEICLFMQERFFENENGDSTTGANAREWEHALRTAPRGTISALGSAPYVESSDALARLNIERILALALQHNLHADFHLDYDTRTGREAEDEALVWDVVGKVRGEEGRWRESGRVVTVGHCTRVGMWSDEVLERLKREVEGLPIWIVGLPQSDMYMMGRPSSDVDGGAGRVRGTLRVPGLISGYGLNMAVAVNNVGNAFTPQGEPDPLGLCPLGVAVYQCGTERECRVLLECVSWRAKAAIGLSVAGRLDVQVGDAADLVVLHENTGVHNAALCPGFGRTTVKGGRVVAERRATRDVWIDKQGT